MGFVPFREKKKLLYALTLMRRVEHLRRIFRITKFKAPEMAADLPWNSDRREGEQCATV